MDADAQPTTQTTGAVVDPVAPRAQPDRLVVPDVLRGIAILAMLIAHAAPLVPSLPESVLFVQSNINDLASPLFALVMGMSTALVMRKAGPSAQDRGLVVVQNAIRGLILVALGLWLTTWGSWIAIILSFLGIVLMVGTPLLLLSTRWILGDRRRRGHPEPARERARAVSRPGDASGGLGPAAADRVALHGHPLPRDEPAAVLPGRGSAPQARLPPRSRCCSPSWASRSSPTRCDRSTWHSSHPRWEPISSTVLALTRSGSYLDTLHDVGLVFTTYVVVVLLATVRSLGAARAIAACFVPLRAIGSVSLSVYVLQVGVVAIMALSPWVADNRWLDGSCWWSASARPASSGGGSSARARSSGASESFGRYRCRAARRTEARHPAEPRNTHRGRGRAVRRGRGRPRTRPRRASRT